MGSCPAGKMATTALGSRVGPPYRIPTDRTATGTSSSYGSCRLGKPTRTVEVVMIWSGGRYLLSSLANECLAQAVGNPFLGRWPKKEDD